MTHIITTQHIQIALFDIRSGVAPEDGRRPPKHIGEENVLLYAYIHIYNQTIGITKRKVPTFQAPAAM